MPEGLRVYRGHNMAEPTENGVFDIASYKRSIIEGLKSAYPIETENKALRLSNVKIGDNNKDPLSWKDIKDAILNKDTIGMPITANFELVDKNTGDVISKTRAKIGVAPTMTKLNTYMVNGMQYNMPLQFRLKAGAYPHRTETGEVEVFNNVKNASPFRTIIDPEKAFVGLKIGQGKVPLYPILKIMGVADVDIEDAIGKELYLGSSNYKEADIGRIYKAIYHKMPDSEGSAEEGIRAYFDKMETDPDINQITIGSKHNKVTGKYLLDTARNATDLIKNNGEGVNRNILAFKRVMGIEDIIGEEIKNNVLSRKNQAKIKRSMSMEDDIRKIIKPEQIKRGIEHVFTTSSLSRYSPQSNLASIENSAYLTTLLGPGGISSQVAIPEDAKTLQNSHMGFLDPNHTPECFCKKTKVFTSEGWMYFKDITPKSKIACEINGKLEYHKPIKIIARHYTGAMYGARSATMDYLVTPNHRMWCKPSDHKKKGYYPIYRYEYASDIVGKCRMHRASHAPYEGIPAVKSLQKITNLIGIDNREGFDPISWASLMGWYLSEGSCSMQASSGSYRVSISQSRKANPDKCLLIETILDKLGYNWCYTYNGDYVISNKRLATYLHQFGRSSDKWIPEEFFAAQVGVRQALVDTLLLGGGKIGNKRKGKPHWNSKEEHRIFFSSSKKLADGFERLAISLGYPTSTSMSKDNRKDSYFDIYGVSLLIHKARCTLKHHYYTKDYDDMVYCLEVPGGKLYTKREESPFWSGNSMMAGSTLSLAMDTIKKGNAIKTKVININTGKTEYLSPEELYDIPLAFPSEYKLESGKWMPVNTDKVHTIYRDKMKYVNTGNVKYMLFSASGMFDISSNLIPFLQSNQGNRGMTSAKMTEQAVSLTNPEKPLVETMENGKSILDVIGDKYSIKATVSGTVVEANEDNISVKAKGGEVHKHALFNNIPLNDAAILDSTVRVKVGDQVARGQLLADSNFTKDGKYVYGINLNTAYVPWKGWNFEDGIVMSEGGAKKLESRHMYKFTIPLNEINVGDLKKFKSYMPYSIKTNDLGKYDGDGTIRIGENVRTGDIIAATLQHNISTGSDTLIAKIKKSAVLPYKDNSQLWDHEDEGTVTDKVINKDGVDIYIKSNEKFRIGDKIVARHGNKGIVGLIIPDDMTPVTETGEKIDVILDPHGVVPRINVGQILENAAGKLAYKTNTPFMVENFSGKDYRSIIEEELKNAGIKERENIFDPETGVTIPNVATGKMYITKLKHPVSKKISSRALSGPYTQDDQPTSGGGTGGQSIDKLTMNALLAYNPRELMQEMFSVKNNRNTEYWRAVQHGEVPKSPGNSFEYEKFKSLLQTMGVNTVDKGSSIKLSPLKDEDVLKMSNGEIINPIKTFKGKGIELSPDKDGLFGDNAGGLRGNKFNHIQLNSRIISPAYKEAIKSLLNMTENEFLEEIK